MEAGSAIRSSVANVHDASSAATGALLHDSAVSPVVGTVLVLAISLIGIVAIVIWGLPAISELKAASELRAALEQFRDLDNSLAQLVSGSARQTSIRWQPSLEQGSVLVNPRGDRWIVAANFTPAGAPAGGYSIRYASASEDDNLLRVYNAGSAMTLSAFKAWQVSGGIETELKVLRSSTVNACGGTVASTPTNLASSASVDIVFCSNVSIPVPVNLSPTLVKLSVYNGTPSAATLAETAWILDLGTVHYLSSSGIATRHIFASNGALAAGPISGLVLQDDVPIPPPTNFTNSTGSQSTSLFVRLLRINGTASFAPGGTGGRTGLFLNLYGTFKLAEESNVTAVKIYDFGSLRDAWYGRLADPLSGFRFVRERSTISGEETEYVVHQEGGLPFRFSLVHSVVTAAV